MIDSNSIPKRLEIVQVDKGKLGILYRSFHLQAFVKIQIMLFLTLLEVRIPKGCALV